MYRQYGKRIFDFIVTLCALMGALPLMLVLWFWVRISLGQPVLFCQVRPGQNGNPFLLFKFRTMREAHDDQGHPLPDAQRLTRFGCFLRSTSLDELPELFNILKGEMSLVGPRPLLMQYLPRYSPQQARRHEVKPGLTGWAQINGRNAVTWDTKFALDVWYADNLSLWLDVKIFVMTFLQIFQRKDIHQPGHATMPEFMGNG